MVFQSYALYPHMNVADNMSYSLRLRKTPREKIAEAIRATSHILGLDPLLARRPKALSGGQRQRVAMGRAIVRKPRAFLFDEPLSNLDARLREQMRTEIKKLHRNLGATSVYVTHDQIEAMTMADRIVAMHDGVVQQVGDPLTIYDWPANIFVAGFIGSPAMNFLKGEIAMRGDRWLVVTSSGCDIAVAALPQLVKGREVVLGVRPEHLGFASAASAEGVDAAIDLIEPMGLSTLVHLTIGQRKAQNTLKLFTLDRPQGKIGSQVKIRFDKDKIHLFDPATGQRLTPPAPGAAPAAL
jgi:multiple sugar transport system ATP-binding protein